MTKPDPCNHTLVIGIVYSDSKLKQISLEYVNQDEMTITTLDKNWYIDRAWWLTIFKVDGRELVDKSELRLLQVAGCTYLLV